MNDNVVQISDAHSGMTVEQALNSTKVLNLEDVLIVGVDKDGDFLLRSSRLSASDALYLMKKAEMCIMDME